MAWTDDAADATSVYRNSSICKEGRGPGSRIIRTDESAEAIRGEEREVQRWCWQTRIPVGLRATNSTVVACGFVSYWMSLVVSVLFLCVAETRNLTSAWSLLVL